MDDSRFSLTFDELRILFEDLGIYLHPSTRHQHGNLQDRLRTVLKTFQGTVARDLPDRSAPIPSGSFYWPSETPLAPYCARSYKSHQHRSIPSAVFDNGSIFGTLMAIVHNLAAAEDHRACFLRVEDEDDPLLAVMIRLVSAHPHRDIEFFGRQAEARPLLRLLFSPASSSSLRDEPWIQQHWKCRPDDKWWPVIRTKLLNVKLFYALLQLNSSIITMPYYTTLGEWERGLPVSFVLPLGHLTPARLREIFPIAHNGCAQCGYPASDVCEGCGVVSFCSDECQLEFHSTIIPCSSLSQGLWKTFTFSTCPSSPGSGLSNSNPLPPPNRTPNAPFLLTLKSSPNLTLSFIDPTTNVEYRFLRTGTGNEKKMFDVLHQLVLQCAKDESNTDGEIHEADVYAKRVGAWEMDIMVEVGSDARHQTARFPLVETDEDDITTVQGAKAILAQDVTELGHSAEKENRPAVVPGRGRGAPTYRDRSASRSMGIGRGRGRGKGRNDSSRPKNGNGNGYKNGKIEAAIRGPW
ncbi:hypothetical protein DL96DRAFT_1615739 [Flagelloscypha sp. PMI_526]|nr:hypothetical protein DL96DRAFT_1615739 [Flagelloscypha sp. PMI_526]